MKKFTWISAALALSVMACNNAGKDSVEKADSTNEAKNDSTATHPNTTLGVDESTSKFMVDVADINMAEVEMGKLAQDKASNQRIKDYAGMMVRDHTSASGELKTLAAQKNVTLPDSVSDEHHKKMDDLKKKGGKDFDKAYINMMEDGHSGAVDRFEKNTDNNDADVRAFVVKMLPTLRMHLDSAKAIKKALGY